PEPPVDALLLIVHGGTTNRLFKSAGVSIVGITLDQESLGMTIKTERRIAIAGLGAIGKVLAHQLDAGQVPGCRLVAVSGRDPEKSRQFTETLRTLVPVVPLSALA